MRSPGYALTCFILATLSLSCSLVDLRRSTDTDCTSQPAEFCTRLNDSQPPADACQSWTCNKATRFCELGPRDLDADGAIDPECAPSGGTHPLDCDDTNANRFPDNPEVCDFIDNNCDNLTDENVYTVFDELTDDPNSMIPNTCPAEAETQGGCITNEATAKTSTFASRSNLSDPQVVATFTRHVNGRGLLGAALFDTEAWSFLGTADLDPEFQPDDPQPTTLYDNIRASSVSLTPLEGYFAIGATGKKNNNTGIVVNGIMAFEAPLKAHIESSELLNDIDVDELVLTGIGEQALSASKPPANVPTLQLLYLDSSGSGCSADAPCLANGDPYPNTSNTIGTQTDQVPAVVSIAEFGWLVAIMDKTTYEDNDEIKRDLVIHHVQSDETHALNVSEVLLDHALSGETLSGLALTHGSSQGASHQLALAYVSDGRLAIHLLALDTSANTPALSITDRLDLSALPGTAHRLPHIVWHSLHLEWVLGYLETSETPVRLFAARFTPNGVLLDAPAMPVFESRILQDNIGFHFKPTTEGFAVLSYQLSGSRGNLIAGKIGCILN